MRWWSHVKMNLPCAIKQNISEPFLLCGLLCFLLLSVCSFYNSDSLRCVIHVEDLISTLLTIVDQAKKMNFVLPPPPSIIFYYILTTTTTRIFYSSNFYSCTTALLPYSRWTALHLHGRRDIHAWGAAALARYKETVQDVSAYKDCAGCSEDLKECLSPKMLWTSS